MAQASIKIPDLGTDAATVIEILVQEGQEIALDQSLITLESAKATMELPSPVAGRLLQWQLALGSEVHQGDAWMLVEVADVSGSAPTPSAAPAAAPAVAPAVAPAAAPAAAAPSSQDEALVHAGPAVRRLAREMGIDLAQVSGHGPHARILKDDIKAYVRTRMQQASPAAPVASDLAGLLAAQERRLRQAGEIEFQPLTRLQKLSARHLVEVRAQVVPVTQFESADITELESFRLQEKAGAAAQGVKLTLLPFLLRALATMLRRYPRFNSEWRVDGEGIWFKQGVHIAVAVDTEQGLTVPVLHDVDRLGIFEIARQLEALSVAAREQKLRPADLSGASMTISSLGGVGGTAFTPVVDLPQVAILGVSRASIQPVWDGQSFQPRRLLPLSLSYDHRVIDGALAARFVSELAQLLQDLRRLLL